MCEPASAAPAVIRARMLGLCSAALLRKVRANAREFSVLCAAKARLRLKPDPANERPLADLPK